MNSSLPYNVGGAHCYKWYYVLHTYCKRNLLRKWWNIKVIKQLCVQYTYEIQLYNLNSLFPHFDLDIIRFIKHTVNSLSCATHKEARII